MLISVPDGNPGLDVDGSTFVPFVPPDASQLACVISASALKAQMEQGKFLVGLNTSLNVIGTGSNIMSFGYSTTSYKSDASGYEESDPDKNIGFNFLPKAGVILLLCLIQTTMFF